MRRRATAFLAASALGYPSSVHTFEMLTNGPLLMVISTARSSADLDRNIAAVIVSPDISGQYTMRGRSQEERSSILPRTRVFLCRVAFPMHWTYVNSMFGRLTGQNLTSLVHTSGTRPSAVYAFNPTFRSQIAETQRLVRAARRC